MNPTSSENDQLMDMVAKLDPASNPLPQAAAAQKRELFDQLMNTDEGAATVLLLEEAKPAREPKSRQRFALPGAIAAALIIVAALFLTLSRPPSAEAALLAAVEETVLVSAGQAEIEIELLSVPDQVDGSVPLPDFRFDYKFDADDYRLDTVIDNAVVVSELRVDDVSYVGTSFSPKDGFDGENLQWSINTGSQFPLDLFGGLAAADAGPESVLPLVELAEDFEQTDTDRGSVYRGTITRDDLLEQEQLPAGIAFVTSGSGAAEDLPETLLLEVEVIDGLVHDIVLIVEGDVPSGGFINAILTTTYFDYGQPQNLQAPAEVVDRPFDVSAAPLPGGPEQDSAEVFAVPAGLPLWAPGPEPQTDDHRVLAEVLHRRPTLCFEAGILDTTQPGEPPSFTLIQSAIVDCFLLAGEPGAAEAVGNILSG